MSYKGFLEEIERGLPSATYLLSASDPFLLNEAMSLVKGLVPEGEREFNFHTFDASSNAPAFDEVLDVLNTMPFFSGRKFVLVENSNKLLKRDLEKLAKYLARPCETSVLILLMGGAAKKDFRGIQKSIALDIGEREIGLWLKGKAKAKGIDLADGAVEYLLATIGPDLGLLSSEIEKCTLIGKKAVAREDIMEVVEGNRSFNPFALVDAIRAKDAALAFKIYRVLRDAEEPYALLGALNWQYAKFPSGKTRQDREYLHRVFRSLNRADVEVKSSGGLYPMELLLAELLRLSRGR